VQQISVTNVTHFEAGIHVEQLLLFMSEVGSMLSALHSMGQCYRPCTP